ncbi:MAG: DNA mismatch endonuclease Vsr [Nitrospinae bacterium]|nr:DNA mismatch endonuclease Vsr [Nitrospinota bacterium]
MVDIVDSATRSRIMSRIKGKDTKPEILIRKALFKQGVRFRIQGKSLPGKPDLVLKKYSTVIFVHGCFWHGHDCSHFRMPSSNRVFWKKKIQGNKRNDMQHLATLRENGWRVLWIWECSIRRADSDAAEKVAHKAVKWLLTKSAFKEIKGGANVTKR